ncbi:hypothetical protein FQN60_011121 [Etheostoma spectabile]|uniref:Uncharacterized protein n=1 Tax=Etheostoma spectabile TaxID=54343 RepID=A0A5J5DR94_9PERO|nr:hypothetical protein FQN60_011121 [Etheostoma spectabile]
MDFKFCDHTGFDMDTLSTYCVEGTSNLRSGEEGKEEEEKEDVEEEKEDGGEDGGEEDIEGKKDESADQKLQRPAWVPCFFYKADKEVYNYVGQEIIIRCGLDSYAGMIWPAVSSGSLSLSGHPSRTVESYGQGGAWVTATDLPEALSNLRANLNRNTRGHCRYTPQVATLSWGDGLERCYPTSVYRYDYVLAADVVYHHDFLDELLVTMKHFCKPGTTLIWANKVRYETDLTFMEKFKKAFHTRPMIS